MTLLGILSGGLWLIPVLLLTGAIVFFIKAFKSSKSGSKINPQYGGGEGGDIPVWQLGYFWYGVVLVAVIIVFFIVQWSER